MATPKQNISAQGLLTSSDSELDLGIDGNGFFVVSNQADGSSVSYTRVGDFETDAEGYLINSNGFYLLAYPTDADGASAVGASSLEPININDLTGLATPTTELSVQGILPAEVIDVEGIFKNDTGDALRFAGGVELFQGSGELVVCLVDGQGSWFRM